MSLDREVTALAYHALPVPGKIAVVPTKPVGTRAELALAYTPGVAEACNAIAANPAEAARLTTRANLVGVISNGTAVLGLGDIGPLAAKPVMEGKSVLFKRLAGIDVFDIEVEARDPQRFIDVVAALEPTFGGINLEDIKAPDCFEIERQLVGRMGIPVMHDDQHGTAVVVAAATVSALHLTGRRLDRVKLVVNGAGAAAIACAELLVGLGLERQNVFMLDRAGLIHRQRNQIEPHKARFAQDHPIDDLARIYADADILLGLSGPRSIPPECLGYMAARPIVMTLANPTPEIMPEITRQARPDAIICTGRSDFPNQVNNALCFPYIFRGALDCGATAINAAMRAACVTTLSELARETGSSGMHEGFGPDYLIPDVLDPRILPRMAEAVARAAAETGAATRPITDYDQYRRRLDTLRPGF